MPAPWEEYQNAPTAERPPWEEFDSKPAPAPAPAAPKRTGAAAIPTAAEAQGKPYEAPAPREADTRSAPRRGLDELRGAFDTVGTILSAIPTSILGMGVEAIAGPEAGRKVMEAGTWQPRTPEGQRNVQAIGDVAAGLPAALPGVAPVTGIAASLSRAGLGRGLEVASKAVKAVPGAVAEGTGKAAAKAVSAVTPGIAPETAAVVRKAARLGIDLPPDAFSKNKFAKVTGEISRNVPASGAGGEANAVAFNKTLARRIGADGAEKITPEVFDKAMEQSGETIGRITEANPVPHAAVEKTIAELREKARTRSGDVGKAVDGYLADIEARAAENGGEVPGGAMKEIMGQMGRDARTATDGNVRNALGELHGALLDDVAKVVGPEDSAILKRARQQYSDALTIAPLINASGDISPAAFNRAFRTGRAGMMRAARGKGGEMGDLATVAQYMREPGTSLTAERAAVLGTLAGTGWIEPHSAATAAATANVYNRLGPRVLREKAGVKKGPSGGANPPEAPPPGAAAAGEPVDLTPIDPAGGPTVPPGGEPPLLGGPGGAAPDPRVVELQALRDGAKSEAVRTALDERLKVIDTETRAKQDAAEFRAAAEQVTDPATKQQLLAKADELDPPAEPIPTGEATEITPEVIEPGALREEGQSPNAGVGKADEAPVKQAGADSAAAPAAQRAQADEGRQVEGEVDGGRLRTDDLQPETRQEGVQADGGAGAQAGKGAGEEGQTHLSLSGFPEIDEGFMREQQRVQEVAKPSPPMSARGLAAVRSALEEGVAAGKLDKDGVSLALWALDRNPNLAKGLKQEGLQVEIAPHAGARGAYNDARELIRLVEGNTDGLTAAHELLHHAERMMPPKMQAGIRREWRRAVQAEIRNVAPLNLDRADALKLALRAMEDGDATAVEAMRPYFRSKVLDRQKDYRLVNPTEYWAENASEILHGRFSGRGSWRAEAVQWLKEMIEHLKGTVGLRSDAPILKALDEILNPAKTTGERKSKNMITGSGRRDQPAQPQAP